MRIFEQIAMTLIVFSPLIIVLGYGMYQYVKCRRLRKSNQQKLANFNAMINEALEQQRSENQNERQA